MMAGWPSTPRDRAHFVAGFYDEHLKTHFAAEEESLFPLVNRHIPEGRPLVAELIAEHRTIEQFIEEFSRAVNDLVTTRLEEFSTILEGHIRKEERRLFPLFEDNASPKVLAQTEKMILDHYRKPKD